MENPDLVNPKWRPKTWQIVVLSILLAGAVGMIVDSGSTDTKSNSSSSSSSATATADLGTRMACEHWRINLANASVETREQQVANAQKVNKYASISTNPAIVSSARAMTEAFLNMDSELYLSYATTFGNACVAMGQ